VLGCIQRGQRVVVGDQLGAPALGLVQRQRVLGVPS
jgi:hypothetical protein